MENFKADAINLRKLFEDSEGFFNIPDYQRKYSWGTEQVEILLEDLRNAYLKHKDNTNEDYFLGSIVRVKKEKLGINDIIDGQQRITTLMILNLVLYKDFVDYLNPPCGNFLDINNTDIKDMLYRKNSNTFRLIVENPNYLDIFNDFVSLDTFKNCKSNCNEKELKKNNNPKINYENTAGIMYRELTKINNEQYLQDFVNFLYNNVYVVRIDCFDEMFAINLFNILNDRGLDLTMSDLLKVELRKKITNENLINDNLLHSMSEKEQEDMKQTIETKKSIEISSFNNTWNNIEKSISNLETMTFDNILIIYEYMQLKKNPDKSVWEELKIIIKDKTHKEVVTDINNILDILEKYIYEIQGSIDGELNQKYIYSLRYLPWKMYILAIIVSLKLRKYSNEDEKKILIKIREFYYKNWIVGKTLSQIKDTSFKLIQYITEKRKVEEIENLLIDKLQDEKITIDDISKVLLGNVVGENWIKPLLLSVEYDIQEDNNKKFLTIDKQIHLEHILPQQYSTEENWNFWDKTQADTILNSLGNVALLNMNKNISAQNYGFDDKIKIYSGEAKDERLKGLSKFDTTKKICIDYDNKKYVDEEGKSVWNIQSVKDRRDYLLKLIGNILNENLEAQ